FIVFQQNFSCSLSVPMIETSCRSIRNMVNRRMFNRMSSIDDFPCSGSQLLLQYGTRNGHLRNLISSGNKYRGPQSTFFHLNECIVHDIAALLIAQQNTGVDYNKEQ